MPPEIEPKRRSVGLRVLRAVGAVVGTLVVFVLSLVGGVLLHLGTPPVRRSVVQHVNAILAPTFKGKIRIDRLGGLGLWGISGADATILDPTGHPVVVVHGARATVATWTLIRSVLFGKSGPMDIKLYGVSIDDVDVRLDTDPDGKLYLLDAFDSPTPPSSTPPPDPNARGVRFEISRLSLKHAWAHGQMAGAPPLDVDLDDVAASLVIAPDVVDADVAKATVVARKIANGADVDGALQGHVRLPSAPDAKPDARAAWRGTAAGIPNSIDASMSNGRVDAVVDVPQATPDQIRALWAASTIDEPGSAHVEAHGTLPNVDVALHAGLGRAGVDLKGSVVVADEKSAKVSIVVHDFDVHELAPAVARTRLGLKGDVSADMAASGALNGIAVLRFEGGVVGGNAIPPASIRASGSRGSDKAMQANLDLVVDEPGAPTHLSAHMTPNELVTFALDSSVADLYAVPELRRVAHGSVKLGAKGTVDVANMTIDAEAHAQLLRVVQGTTKVEGAALDATARGALTEPHLDAVLQVDGVVAAGLRFVTARVHADGPPLGPHIDLYARGPDTPDIDASVDVGMTHGISLGDVRVALMRAGEKALVTAARVNIDGGNIQVDNARIAGLGGDTTAVVSMTPGELRVRASTHGIDLGRVARLANIQKKLQAGTLAFDVDLNVERIAASGRVALSVDNAKIQNFSGVSVKVDATLDGRKVVAKVHGEAAGVATIDVDAPSLQIGGEGALSARSWRAAWGSVAIDAEADLAKLSKLIPPEQSPVDEARGTISIKGHVERDDLQDYTPDVSLDVTTQNLIVTPKTARERHHDMVLVMDPAPWTLSGLDFQIHTTINGKSGALKFDTVVHDTKGEIAELQVDSAHIPYEDVFNSNGRLMEDLRATAFDVHFVAPERDLASLPSIMQQTYVTGVLKADVAAKGTMIAPTVDVTASLVKGKGQWVKRPIDLDLAAHYDGTKGTASVKATSRGRAMLDAEATFDAAIARILASDGDLPWTASAKAHLDSFPMQSVTFLNDKMVKGLVSGDVKLDGFHQDAKLEADITIASLAVGTVGYKGAKIHASADGKSIDASARIDQTDGFLEAKAKAMASWGAAMAPTLDPAQPLNATLSSKNFRVVALQPFLDGVFDELDGRIDSAATVALDPKDRGAKLSGNIALRRGTIEAVAGGGEIHDITGNVKFAPDGTITLEKLTGYGLTGHFDATGVAHVSGTTLQSAKMSLNIPHNAAIPLSAGGSEIGNVDGRIDLSATGGANGAMQLAIAVPKLRVALPEGSTTSAVSLGPMAKVSIGSHRGAPMTFVVIPIDPSVPVVKSDDTAAGGVLTIQVNLGDVQVIRGQELKVDLNGKLAIKAGDTTVVSGQIHLIPGGTLTEQGKTFTVESGSVTFVGDDPSNPEIVVQASWTAPDGTVVFANFVGPLKTGKVTLRSEPALPRDEIVQLLLFGAADGQSAQAPSSQLGAQNTAAVAAGGEAAAPLNHALGQLGLGAVTTKIDTSQTNPKPEVEVQIASDLSLQIAVVLGIPPPGVNPDHTLFTLDWRFASKWSLASTVGDAGTTIFDMLWKKRY